MFAQRSRNQTKTSTEERPKRADAARDGKTAHEPNAVWQSLALQHPCCVQPKLSVSQPDDPHEREADRIADTVMRMPDQRAAARGFTITPRASDQAQRKCGQCRAEEEVQRKAHAEKREHIASGQGQYAPSARGGQRLLARELAHVARQADESVSASPPTEDEASANPDFQREHICLANPNPANPTRREFTQRERGRAAFGLSNSKSIASQAYMKLGRRDPYHLRMAERTFHTPVSFEELDRHFTLIRTQLNRLVLGQNVVAATCDEGDCNDGVHNFVAVTMEDLSTILLCPFYFIQPARTLVTTFIHEAGHMANIDVNWAPGNERYCRGDDVIECDNICPLSGDLLENVDAWMRFMYCIAMSS